MNKKHYIVHHIESPEAKSLLAEKCLTVQDLARAIAEFQRRDGVTVRTAIGITADGFFGSARDNWHPGQPDAFAKPLIHVPWVQILEYLGRLPDGTTGDLLKAKGKKH